MIQIFKYSQENADNSSQLTFVERFPLKSCKLKNMHTSGMLWLAAMIKDDVKFSTPSVLVSKMGICDPVTITVLPKFSRRYDNAEAV